ncbi:MAG: glucokinase [Lewinellaceae bacterium]|nr:glucokinase [Lewinellaceae bacterium]
MHNSLVPIAFPDRKQVLPDGATLLAADVGGTKTILALIEIHDGDASFIKETVYPSRQFGSLAEAVRTFMAGSSSRPERFSIAFAGPVQEGKAYATNLGWHLDTRLLIEELGIPQVFLINDLEAEAYGLAALTEKDLVTIYPGKAQPKGNAAIIAPGTGLGEAGLYWDGAVLHPFATEGGHTDFAPRNDFDWELLQYLQNKYGHVSWERVVSGLGICNIYDFLRDVKNWEEPAEVQEQMKTRERGAVIGSSAQEGCPISMETLRVFMRYLAVESSNLALKLNATGGIFIGGGIPPKIWNEHLQAIFLEHFIQVGRLRPLIETVPVHVVLNTKAVLLGAAYYGKC